MRVDLPEPDGPITVVSWPSVDVERDPAQGLDGRVALAVAAGDVLCDDDGSVRVHPDHPIGHTAIRGRRRDRSHGASRSRR